MTSWCGRWCSIRSSQRCGRFFSPLCRRISPLSLSHKSLRLNRPFLTLIESQRSSQHFSFSSHPFNQSLSHHPSIPSLSHYLLSLFLKRAPLRPSYPPTLSFHPFQLADLRSVGISGAPLNFVDSNSFNRIFTMGPMGKNIFHNFTQNTSSSIFFIFCPLMTLSEPTWMVH